MAKDSVIEGPGQVPSSPTTKPSGRTSECDKNASPSRSNTKIDQVVISNKDRNPSTPIEYILGTAIKNQK